MSTFYPFAKQVIWSKIIYVVVIYSFIIPWKFINFIDILDFLL